MWPKHIIFISLASCCLVLGKKSQIFDVTTIFDVGNYSSTSTEGVAGRVHSRTNALGLPLYKGLELQNKTVKPNITCDSITGVCPWTVKGWDLTPSHLPFYDYGEVNSFLNFQRPIKISMIGQENLLVNLYFTSEATLSGFQGYHEIMIKSHPQTDSFSIEHRFCSCDIPRGEEQRRTNSYDFDPDYGYSRYHNIIMRCGRRDTYKTKNRILEIRLEEGKLLLDDSFKVLKWTEDYKVQYVYIKDDFKRYIMNVAFNDKSGQSYISDAEGSEMASPSFTLDDRKLCLSLVIHVPSLSEESVLDIFSEDPSAERQFLISVKDLEAGWNIKHYNVNFPSKIKGLTKLVIKKTNGTAVKISRISSCSSDGSDVEIIPSVKLDLNDRSNIPLETQYSATAYALEPAERLIANETSVCANGGLLTSDGCACPPGMYGHNCQSGCGRNRYGQDCGGLCSLRHGECQGLMLCTYTTGCHCGPGYRGVNCMEKCSDGYYGNDCNQKCGHCEYGTCDIYTGECSACESGYLPPFHCNKESVYYPLAPQLSSQQYNTITVTFDSSKYKTYFGPPVAYQMKYRDTGNKMNVWGNNWKTYKTKDYPEDSGLTSEDIVGLRDGVLYEVKILLMDENFNKYDGNLIQTSEILTKCEIPDVYNYSVQYESGSSEIRFSWNYEYVNTTLHWCPVEQYEVSWKEDWQWFTKLTEENEFSITDLLPGSPIQFKVRAKTGGGFFPFSDTIVASTSLTELASVRNLSAKSRKSSSMEVTWEPPIGCEGKQLQYTVEYKCVNRPACISDCQGTRYKIVQDTNITLDLLLPFSQYWVRVKPENGKTASIYVGTSEVVPTEVVTLSVEKPVRTNNSVTVFWDEVPVCSSFLLGYNYQLTKESESLNTLETGFTRNTNATFHNLTASTLYIVNVFVRTHTGWDPDSFLSINVSTSATVPEAVRNLTVYKSGRGMLGLRWAEPKAMYGQLKSFTVTHSLGQESSSHTIEPSHCAAWPDLYCHTIEGLRSNRRYNISVSARNSEIPEDGQPTFVTVVTKESLPSPPQNLKVINSTSTSLELKWNYPEMPNGVVRSFLISVEETEKYDLDSCCQVYPLTEIIVKEELKNYTAEVSGLHPASTYFVSISAKTVGLGPSQSLVVSTMPPHLPFTSLPRVEMSEVTWLPQENQPELNNSDVYMSLVRAHLLLAVLNETQLVPLDFKTGVTDSKLDSLLHQKIGTPFYFVAEYNQDEEVELSGSLEDRDSTWGRPPASLSPGRIQLLATQVLEYNGVYNVDLRYSQFLTMPN